jgi:futalosine hydrolase
MTRPTYGGIPIDDFVAVHAAILEGRGLDDLRTWTIGVGKTAAAVSMHALLRSQPAPRGVLLFGLAGAVPDRLRPDPAPVGLLAPCLVVEDRFGDEGVATPDGFLAIRPQHDFATEWGRAPGDTDVFAAHRRAAEDAARRLGAPLVRGTTVSTCSGTDDLARAMYARTGADVETMEGAAVAYVCRQFEVPLLHLRVISNWTGDRDRGEWNLGAAVDALTTAVRRLFAAD